MKLMAHLLNPWMKVLIMGPSLTIPWTCLKGVTVNVVVAAVLVAAGTKVVVMRVAVGMMQGQGTAEMKDEKTMVPEKAHETVPEMVPETVPEMVPETVPEMVLETVPGMVLETVPGMVLETVPGMVLEIVQETAPGIDRGMAPESVGMTTNVAIRNEVDRQDGARPVHHPAKPEKKKSLHPKKLLSQAQQLNQLEAVKSQYLKSRPLLLLPNLPLRYSLKLFPMQRQKKQQQSEEPFDQ